MIRVASGRCLLVLLPVMLLVAPGVGAHENEDVAKLTELSLEDLLDLEVVSVSKKKEPYFDTAAATYVLTADDIRHLGASSLPEALRAVPGLQVARLSPSRWAVSARGFNGVWANKLLVMIDGRTIYSPLFSGVFWDTQELPMDQIERIEIVRGPGGAIWGANAVNGVINVITKPAVGKATEQTFRVGSGQDHFVADLAQTVPISPGAVRGYLRYADRSGDSLVEPSERTLWNDYRGGFRLDVGRSYRDEILLQGDIYRTTYAQTVDFTSSPLPQPLSDGSGKGANLLARWTRRHEKGSITLQSYFDEAERDETVVRDRTRTYDVELRANQALATQLDVTFGGGGRWVLDDLAQGGIVSEGQGVRTSQLWNVFAQGELRLLDDRLRLILGSKLEESGSAGVHLSPTARVAVRPSGHQLVWGAVSRAVSTPSRIMESVTMDLHGPVAPGLAVQFISRPGEGLTEKVTAYELGYRAALGRRLQLDVAAYHNAYDSLLGQVPLGPPTISVTPAGQLIRSEFMWISEVPATATGAEFALQLGRLGPLSRLRAGYTWQSMTIKDQEASFAGLTREGANPTHQAFLTSTAGVQRSLQIDGTVRWISRLDDVQGSALATLGSDDNLSIDSYITLDAALRWSPWTRLELTVGGRNLIGPDFAEFQDFVFGDPARPTGRTYYTQVHWEL